MTTTAGSPYGRPFVIETAPRAMSVVRKQIRTAIALTLFTVALSIATALTLGREVLVIFLLQMPVPLALLWLSTDAVRADEGRPALS